MSSIKQYVFPFVRFAVRLEKKQCRLKLDCEGCEWEVLAQWDRLGHLFREVSIELHNGSMTEVTEDTRRHLEEKLLSKLCLHMDTEDVPRCRSYG